MPLKHSSFGVPVRDALIFVEGNIVHQGFMEIHEGFANCMLPRKACPNPEFISVVIWLSTSCIKHTPKMEIYHYELR